MELQADYGYDAPYALIAFTLLGALATAVSHCLGTRAGTGRHLARALWGVLPRQCAQLFLHDAAR